MDGSSHRTPPCTARLSSRFSCRSGSHALYNGPFSILLAPSCRARRVLAPTPHPGTDPARGDPVSRDPAR